MLVVVNELFAVNYPTLEGGFTIETNDITATIKELKQEYAFVDECMHKYNGHIEIDVYMHC